ncbi:hypothetical protein BC937DRAFT_92381 [Endogone sp. FLAS-F59071]|nr:hypothetical protein BC937DRAFT_92381 [Endogone sp. FLAS-F59071]|eukprot:RUS15490.1 hypothetical protein BC937DRAFT_92381 [Endogone sp. FLAS-F59071]
MLTCSPVHLFLLTLRTFESIIEDYLNNTTCTEWSILSILKYTESKEKIYVDDVGSLKDAIYTMFRHYKSRKNIQQRVNGKLGKLLDNYDVSFGTPKVKRFLNDLRIREEEDDLQVSFEIRDLNVSPKEQDIEFAHAYHTLTL